MIELLPFEPVSLPFFNRVAILFINFVVVTLILTVLNHDKLTEKKSITFLGMSIFMVGWVDFAYLARIAGENEIYLAEIFLRIAWVATPLLFFTTYLISLQIGQQSIKQKTQVLILSLMTLATSVFTAVSDFFIAGITFVGTNVDIDYGEGFYVFLGVIVILIVSTLLPLIKTKLTPRSRAFLAGVGIFYLMNLIFNIVLPVVLDVSHLYYFGDYSTLILLAFTSYAIIRHKLFEIRVVAAELITAFIWMLLLSRVLVAESLPDLLIDLSIFVSVVIFGILLIRSVIKETRQKEELQVLAEKLKKIDKQKDEFLSVATHELRAPLTAIKGYISMMIDGDFGQLSAEVNTHLVEVSETTDRLVRLVNNMLNVSRIEEGRMVYQMGVVSLSKVALSTYNEFKFTAENQKLALKLEIPQDIVDSVYVDQDRIHELVANLVSNAIKYTKAGSVTIRILQRSPEIVRLEVSDTGIGISPEEQQKLFNKFVRVESAVGKTVGSGLGLYVSKLLVEKFGGKIGLNSQVGKGSTFWFELPVVSKSPTMVSDDARQSTSEQHPATNSAKFISTGAAAAHSEAAKSGNASPSSDPSRSEYAIPPAHPDIVTSSR